jgi:type I restriction enzyme S subunit
MATENKKYIPALRFPEFQNDGEWKYVTIGDIISTINPPKKLQSSEYKKKGAFPIVDQSASYIAGYSDNGDAVIDNNGYNYIVFGDHTCSLKLIDFPFIQGADGIKIFKSKITEVLTEYLYQYIFAHPINSKEYKRHFSDLKEKPLLYPTKACEQKKIADCLSSLDKYIDATKRKLELLKEHKKGLMQRLFPAKGKTTP